MGSICSKGICPDDDDDDVQQTDSLNPFATLSKKEEVVVAIADVALGGSHHNTPKFLSKPSQENGFKHGEEMEKRPSMVNSERVRNSVGHQRRATVDVGSRRGSSDADHMPNGAETTSGHVNAASGLSGGHDSGGWPSWFTDVAGEAIKGWQPRRSDSFEKLEKIGQGTYSSVYKARDLETGKIVALKKVRFFNMDPESVSFMAREIHILRKLDHPNVIKLEGIITSPMSPNLYLVFDYMEHDLAGLAARPGVKFTEPQVKCFMQQLLQGLAHCHSRGVLHRDIKGSNLLIDNNGVLKIGDFGLATSFDPNQKQQLTSRVVTLWYRPPELLLGTTEYDVAVDLWSSGCILAELFAGKPIMPGRTEVEQLHKIFKLCGSPSEDYWSKLKLPHTTVFKPQRQYKRCLGEVFKEFPSSALALLDSLLAIEPENRGTAASALTSGFFTTKPLACDPSNLPKFPPSKEYDIKLRNEQKRQKTEAANVRQAESVRPIKRQSKAMLNQDEEMKHGQSNVKGPLEVSVTGFRIDPPGRNAPNGFFETGMHPNGYISSWNKNAIHQEHRSVHGRSYSSVRVSNGLQLKAQMSYIPQSSFRHNKLVVAQPFNKPTLDRTASSHRKHEPTVTKDSIMGYSANNKSIRYSGPLMGPGGNIEDMLKEHDRQIQEAVRKARLDKVKTKKNY